MTPPKLIERLLKEAVQMVEKKEVETRLRIASLEGELAMSKAELAEYQDAGAYIDDFNAAQ